MENFGTKLENVIIKSFTILRNNDSGSRLKFPTYRNGQRRVSEQELRFVFVEQLQDLLKEYDFFYSIETPTNGKYKFSENGKYGNSTPWASGFVLLRRRKHQKTEPRFNARSLQLYGKS